MKRYTYIKTSEMSVVERERVIDLYLIMFPESDNNQPQIIESADIFTRQFGSGHSRRIDSVLAILKRYNVDGVIVDDATEVN
jgi:hypothetical protein